DIAMAASTRPADFELKMRVLSQAPAAPRKASASKSKNPSNGAITDANKENAAWPYANSMESSGQ
ncbi:MAG: hypothetical protein ACREOG_07685, partial [Gemmatimonadaceae bacterium]